MQPKNADEAARQLVAFDLHNDLGEAACAEKIRALFPDIERDAALLAVAAAIRWKTDRDRSAPERP